MSAGAGRMILPEDWDLLFGAVRERLRRLAQECPPAVPAGQPQDAVRQLQAGVADCVAALDQLQRMLAQEPEQRGRQQEASVTPRRRTGPPHRQ